MTLFFLIYEKKYSMDNGIEPHGVRSADPPPASDFSKTKTTSNINFPASYKNCMGNSAPSFRLLTKNYSPSTKWRHHTNFWLSFNRYHFHLSFFLPFVCCKCVSIFTLHQRIFLLFSQRKSCQYLRWGRGIPPRNAMGKLFFDKEKHMY